MSQSSTQQACYHCGDVVPAKASFTVEILGQQREMCCPGCQSVAQTIVESGLDSYYQYRTSPAEKADQVKLGQVQARTHHQHKGYWW